VSGASASSTCLESLDILVLAGGLGTRIRPVLGDLPKLLAPISGRPYLAHLLDRLRHFGARRVVLGLGHGARAVLDHLQLKPPHGLELVTVVEPQPLGTAGAIRFARKELHSDPVLVMNGDSFTEANLCEFVERHRAARSAGAVATVLCAEVDDAGRYGRVEIDEHCWIHRFVEKDATFSGNAAISAGVYLLSAPLLDDIAAGQAASIEHDVFQRMPPRSLAAYSGRFGFIDIGTPQSLARASSVFGGGSSGPSGGNP
jgi:NDP-sugar pyrophosphorylase family protein